MKIKAYLIIYKIFVIFFGTYVSFLMCAILAVMISYFAGVVAGVKNREFIYTRLAIPSLGAFKVLTCVLFKIAKIDLVMPLVNNLVSLFAIFGVFYIIYLDSVMPSVSKNLFDSKRFVILISILTATGFDGITWPMHKVILTMYNNKEIKMRITKYFK